jgi:hypothetical protein
MSESSFPARDKWREVIERQRASGLAVATFCRQNAVAASSFFAWKRRLSATAPAFVEATAAARPSPPKSDAETPAARPEAGVAGGEVSAIEVRLRGGRRVRVRRGFDRALLAEVVAALEESSSGPEAIP